MRASVIATVTATLVAACPVSFANADEMVPPLDQEDYSVVELASGESISIPHGYDVGLIEEKPSSTRMFSSANTAPSCVQAKVEKLAVQVYNNCTSDIRVKVIMTSHTAPVLGAKDSACKTVVAGTRANVRWIVRGYEKVDRVELC